ncbi:MAG TPA: hypothetical protein VL422_07325, partial [Miltoncostaea sp.]|nr:hypothetical protein [Miltoncostaea sp.]
GTVAGDPAAARIGGGLTRLLADRRLPRGAIERRLAALAAAASGAGATPLRPGDAPLAPPVVGPGAAGHVRALDGVTARLRAATAAGDGAGVAAALRDAALLAPALGDAVARRAPGRGAAARRRARAEVRLASGLRRFATLR